MIHITDAYLGQTPQGHVHETICKMRFGCAQRLAKGGKINLGARDGDVCAECAQHLMGVGGSSFLDPGAPADPSLGGLIQETLHADQDGRRAVTRVSGAPILATVEAHTGGALGEYGFTHASEGEDPNAGVSDPYGEGDVAAKKGADAAGAGALCNANPYTGKNAYLASCWAEGWRKGRRLRGLPV
jgi:hypothetical protein